MTQDDRMQGYRPPLMFCKGVEMNGDGSIRFCPRYYPFKEVIAIISARKPRIRVKAGRQEI